MNVKPLKKICLIAENAVESVTASGIVLESLDGFGDSKTGTVLAIGPEVTDVSVGDVVLPTWSKGQVVSIDGHQRVMIKEEDIIAVLGGEND